MDPKNLIPDYRREAPSPQAMIDIFKGHWVSKFPPELGIEAGETAHFDDAVDARVAAVGPYCDFFGKSVLELGPAEGYHTWRFCRLGASPVIAVEGNDIAFLKCLIVKQLLKFDAQFLHGDILPFLQQNDHIFDIIWACGVLYHSTDPLLLLQSICDHAKSVFVWTHYWSEEMLKSGGPNVPFFDASKDYDRCTGDFTARMHFRTYGDGQRFAGFSGGSDRWSCWMEKSDILRFVESRGFRILMESSMPDAPPGPAMMFFAKHEEF
jgi:SAM-dependent methyltransferase